MLQGGVGERLPFRRGGHLLPRPGVGPGSRVQAVPVHAECLSQHPVHRRRAAPVLLLVLHVDAAIAPAARARVVVAGLPVPAVAAEQPVEVLGIPEPLLHDARCVGVVDHVVLEPAVVAQDVVDQSAEEGDVAAGPDADVHVAQRRHAGVARVDVDQGRALGLRLHRPAEADGMGLGHVRAHEQDAVAVREVLLVVGGRAAAERRAQTGHRGAMSYPGLILDGDHAQSAAEQLLDQVVLLVVDRRPAEGSDRADRVEEAAGLAPHREVFVPRSLGAAGDLVQGPVQRCASPNDRSRGRDRAPGSRDGD